MIGKRVCSCPQVQSSESKKMPRKHIRKKVKVMKLHQTESGLTQLLQASQTVSALLSEANLEGGSSEDTDMMRETLKDAVLTYVHLRKLMDANYQFFVIRPGDVRLEPVSHILDRMEGWSVPEGDHSPNTRLAQ
ncbi:MAG: hypothetical protein ORN49_13955 [Rhodobacteraceae bacterium]|nr:hypothetical protein [Paracoccaceae bacterium]